MSERQCTGSHRYFAVLLGCTLSEPSHAETDLEGTRTDYFTPHRNIQRDSKNKIHEAHVCLPPVARMVAPRTVVKCSLLCDVDTSCKPSPQQRSRQVRARGSGVSGVVWPRPFLDHIAANIALSIRSPLHLVPHPPLRPLSLVPGPSPVHCAAPLLWPLQPSPPHHCPSHIQRQGGAADSAQYP